MPTNTYAVGHTPHRTLTTPQSPAVVHIMTSRSPKDYVSSKLPDSFLSLFRKSGRGSTLQDASTGRQSPATATQVKNGKVATGSQRQVKDAENGQKADNNRKNFYRQPSTRQRALSTTTFARAESLRRRRFAEDRLRPWNSEPEDIYSCSDTSDMEQGDDADYPPPLTERRQTLDACRSESATAEDEEEEASGGASPSFRPRAKSMPAASSILKKSERTSAFRQRQNSTKQCCFKDEVDVYYFDRQGESQEVKTNSKDMEKLRSNRVIISGPFVDNSAEESNNYQLYSSDNTDKSRVNAVASAAKAAPPQLERSCSESSAGPLSNIDVKIVPYVDGNGANRKKVLVRLCTDETCIKDRTSVKALSGGTAVIVLVYQNEATDGGSAILHQHMERIALPAKVNPYQVKAQLHKTGILEINAPIAESGK